MTDYSEKTIKSLTSFLFRWNGGFAQLLELTVSHKSLRLLLTKPDAQGNLLIVCLDPMRISASISWNACSVSVATTVIQGEVCFRIIDENADVEILCGGVEVKENVKL